MASTDLVGRPAAIVSAELRESTAAADLSALGNILTEDWLDVDNRSAVQCFEAAHVDSRPIDGRDFHAVKSNGIGAVRRAGTEDAFALPRGIPARMYAQYIAAGAIKPCEHDDGVAGVNVPQSIEHFRLEDKPGVRRAFIRLTRGRGEFSEGRVDPTDDFKLDRHLGTRIRGADRNRFEREPIFQMLGR